MMAFGEDAEGLANLLRRATLVEAQRGVMGGGGVVQGRESYGHEGSGQWDWCRSKWRHRRRRAIGPGRPGAAVPRLSKPAIAR